MLKEAALTGAERGQARLDTQRVLSEGRQVEKHCVGRQMRWDKLSQVKKGMLDR